MFEIQALINVYNNNRSTPYNPKPLYDYLRQNWITTTQEVELRNYLMNSDLECPFKEVNLLLQKDLNALLGGSPHRQIPTILANFKLLITLLSSKILPGIQPQTAKTIHILNSLIELFTVLKEQLAESSELPDYSDEYEHALILPGGHCFVISDAYKMEIYPDPSAERSSLHTVKVHDGIYYFGVNITSKPSAEILGHYLVTQMDPKCSHLYPTKSPCTLLTRTRGKVPVFSTALLQLSKEVPGVTLESLILARDAFQVLSPKSDADMPKAIVKILKGILKHPPTAADFTETELLKRLPKQYREHPICKDIFPRLFTKKHKAKEIYIALKILKILPQRPIEEKLVDWILTAIPHLNGLMELLRHYGKNRSKSQFLDLLKEAIANINPQHIHLLGLSCAMLFDHDAAGTNFIIDMSETPHALTYIDADYRMAHPPIARKRSSTSSATSSSSTQLTPSFRYYAQINSILTVFKPFHEVPLSDQLIERMRSTTAEELFFACLNAAREYEQKYTAFLKMFPISEKETAQLCIPLKLSKTLVLQAYGVFQAAFITFNTDKCRFAIDILQGALPNTARIARLASQESQACLSGWRDAFLTHCPPLGELFAKKENPVIENPHEIGYDSSRLRDYHGLTNLILLFLLDSVDYKDITDAAHERLCTAIHTTLVNDEVMQIKEWSSIKQRNPRRITECIPSPSEMDELPPSDGTESATSTPRTHTPRLERIASFFRRTKLGVSGEMSPDGSAMQRPPSDKNLSASPAAQEIKTTTNGFG